MVTRFEIRDLNLDLRSIRHARMQAVAQQQPNSSPQGLLGMGGAAANAARGSGRSAGRAAARVAAQRPLAAKRPERPKAAKWPCGRRPRGEAVERPEAVGGGHYRRPAAAKVWLWAAAVSAAAAAISGHSRFSSLALVLLVSLALWEGPSQGDVLPFSIVRAPPTPCLCVDRCFPFLCSAYLHSLFVPQEALVVAVGAAGSATRRGSSAIKANVSRQ